MRLFFRRTENFLEALKQDQSGIVAQNFLLCGNLRLEFFRELLFITRTQRAVKCRASNCRKDCALNEEMNNEM
jgi:hypothetical protein